MIAATINTPFTAVLDAADPGRAAHLTVEVYDGTTDTLILTASGTGIAEDPDSPGRYTATRIVTVSSTPGKPFELRWREDGEIAGVEDLTVGESITPSVDDVALLLRTRTVGGTATGLGGDTGPDDLTTFTDSTRPNAAEVERIIERSRGVVIGELEPLEESDIKLAQYAQVREAIALYAAAWIESSFFRDQNNQAPSDLTGRYDTAIAKVSGAHATDGRTRRMVSATLSSPFSGDDCGGSRNLDFTTP